MVYRTPPKTINPKKIGELFAMSLGKKNTAAHPIDK